MRVKLTKLIYMHLSTHSPRLLSVRRPFRRLEYGNINVIKFSIFPLLDYKVYELALNTQSNEQLNNAIKLLDNYEKD